ncbi:unknown protein [Seminavis robusta]|uniref:Uncharacterized protein n=1 Tax=Seminavis robusta TaxID=568900 RepID=A0A9N8H3E7_9STRA|nr:unknown protein [Seminavis robusta]|eukprot:Sro85_g045340.1 n/a (221) ;mRNA; r:59475-60137
MSRLLCIGQLGEDERLYPLSLSNQKIYNHRKQPIKMVWLFTESKIPVPYGYGGPPGSGYVTILAIGPVSTLDETMKATEKKFPLVLWSLERGHEYEVKATVVLLERFECSAKFRLRLRGFLRVNGVDGAEEEWTIVFTHRVRWGDPELTNMKSTSSKSRQVDLAFDYGDEGSEPNDFTHIQFLLPKTAESDKGKALFKALNWARSVVAAKMDLDDFKQTI